MTEKIIDKMTAEKEFEKFVGMWDIDSDIDEMEQESRDGFLELKRRFIRAVKAGRASVSDDEAINYRLINPVHEVKEMILSIPKGRSYLSMDRYKDRESMHKVMALMADMTGKPVKVFSAMDGRDMKFFQAVTMLFLGS